MITLIATIVILGVLIFVHELGHFATAKWANIEVPRFSIGLGPKMVGFTRGETEYVIAWLPLGGYVRMAGMDDMEALEGGEHDAGEARSSGRDFESKSLPARALVISAGVIMNMLFAWLLFAVIAMGWGVRPAPPPVVGGISEESLTEETVVLRTIPMGAEIARINGEPVENWTDVQRLLVMTARDSVRIELESGRTVAVPAPQTDSARELLATALEPRLAIPARLGTIVAGSAADEAGLQPGDEVVAAAGQPIDSWQEMVAVVETRPAESVELTVLREGERTRLTVTPAAEELGPGVTVGRIGVGRAADVEDPLPRERIGPVAAVVHGAEETWAYTTLILDYLAGLFTGQASARDVGGPILIYQISERVVQVGMDAYLNFMAIFSINLAILNLLPIPILDGGQLVFLAVEAVRGKPLSVDQRVRLSQFGLVLVVAIMVWALANDVLRLFGL